MWDFFGTVRHRHSIRKYHSDMAVEPEKIHAILEMACAAPSAGDLQSYRILVVQREAIRKRLREVANNQAFIEEAPLCLVFCADSARAQQQFGERGKQLYAVQDATIAAAYAQLAIVAAGMGSTWIGYFDEAKVHEVLQLDDELQAVAMLSVGYPAELPEATARRKMEEVVGYL